MNRNLESIKKHGFDYITKVKLKVLLYKFALGKNFSAWQYIDSKLPLFNDDLIFRSDEWFIKGITDKLFKGYHYQHYNDNDNYFKSYTIDELINVATDFVKTSWGGGCDFLNDIHRWPYLTITNDEFVYWIDAVRGFKKSSQDEANQLLVNQQRILDNLVSSIKPNRSETELFIILYVWPYVSEIEERTFTYK